MFMKLPGFHGFRLAGTIARFLVLVIGVSWGFRALAAGKDDLEGEDQKALAGYHLTLEKLDKFDAVSKKIGEAMPTDPQLTKEMSSGILNVGSTLNDALGQFDNRAPHLAAILKSAGTTSRDFVMTMFSVMFATTGQMMKQAEQPLPAFIPADNVALAEKNAARFREVMNSVDSLTKRARKKQGSEDAADE